MRTSRRAGGEAIENRWSRAIREARAAGRPILDLTVSNPTAAGVPYDERAIRAALDDPGVLAYEPSPLGPAGARAAVAEALAVEGLGVDPNRLVLTASTSEAYAFLLKLWCDAGDSVLVPRPSYPLLDELARLEAVELASYRLAWDGEWHVDVGSLRSVDRARARAVIAVSPNNPTGSYVARGDLDALSALGVPVIVDEVFAPYPLETELGARSALTTDREVVVLGGLSKHAALPQMKVGWIAVGGSDAFARRTLGALERIADAFLSVSTPSLVALPRWLEASKPTRDAIRERARRNLAEIRRVVGGSSPISAPRVEGGWYACLRVPAVRDDEAWALRLLERGVLAQPGYLYDFPDGEWLVVSLLTPEAELTEGIARIARLVGEGEP